MRKWIANNNQHWVNWLNRVVRLKSKYTYIYQREKPRTLICLNDKNGFIQRNNSNWKKRYGTNPLLRKCIRSLMCDRMEITCTWNGNYTVRWFNRIFLKCFSNFSLMLVFIFISDRHTARIGINCAFIRSIFNFLLKIKQSKCLSAFYSFACVLCNIRYFLSESKAFFSTYWCRWPLVEWWMERNIFTLVIN